ncbi:MAG: universal stress protein [Sphingobacteriales bacterium]|nr:universal stress protein [Sphingobacteriales bacterium]
MNTLLVLIDFSEASCYAAAYACILARQFKSNRIVLLHKYQDKLTISETEYFEGNSDFLHEKAMIALEELALSQQAAVADPGLITFNYRADYGPLDDINEIAAEEGAQLLVLGTTGKTKMQEILIGSNAMNISKYSSVPVVLVPPKIEMQPVQKIIFACDFKVEATFPKTIIKKLLDEIHLPITIVNVDKGNTNTTATGNCTDNAELNELMSDYNPTYNYISNTDTVTGILEFAAAHINPLILLVIKEHGLQGLFHQSITRQLTRNTPIPLLILNEYKNEII